MAVRTPAPRPAMRRANRRACRIVCEAADNPKVPEGLVAPPPPVPLPPEMEARRQELAKAAALEAKLAEMDGKAPPPMLEVCVPGKGGEFPTIEFDEADFERGRVSV